MRKTSSVLWVKVVWAALVPSGQNICTLSLSAKRNTKISNIEFFCVCFHYYGQPKDTTLKSCFELEQFGKRTPASSVPGPDSHLHSSFLSQSNLYISAAMLQYFILLLFPSIYTSIAYIIIFKQCNLHIMISHRDKRDLNFTKECVIMVQFENSTTPT